jgi:hypothetical protein
MPSMFDRLGSFARSSQGKSLIQKATERFTGGDSGRSSGRSSAARKSARRGRRKTR